MKIADVPNYPVGEITSDLQLAAELRIAGDRVKLCGMPDWADRFYALESAIRTRAALTAGNR